jgi:acyl-CoA reductase-like NAD-dependent aldehyde dehydrogenase
MTTKPIQALENQIEQLVRAHLAAQRQAATAAVERAFAAATCLRKTTPTRVTTGRRRARSEMSDLADRLYQAVRANPGESIAVIAAELGHTAKALHRPMVHLKRAGRVRSAGQRHLTRYFPMPNGGRSA